MMRKKRRYIAFHINGNATPTDVIMAIDFIRKCAPSAGRSLWLVIYDEASRKGLLRCNHNQVDEIKEVLSREKISDKFSLTILGVSGTIRAAKRKFLTSGGAKD